MKNTRLTEEISTAAESKALILKIRNDSTFRSLLYVTRKLGEVEGMISMQAVPNESLINVQSDFKRVYDKLIEESGIELLPESETSGIGSDWY